MASQLSLGSQDHLTFKGNLKATRYGWLRLTPAYSVHLVSELLERSAFPGSAVLDPYCGTGTTSLVCAEQGTASWTTDINPFLIWLARVKAASYSDADIEAFSVRAKAVSAAILDKSGGAAGWVPKIHQIEKWWDPPTLHALARAMGSLRDTPDSEPVRDLLDVAFCRTLIGRASVSFGHQSMSFKKRRAEEMTFDEAHLIGLVDLAWREAVESLVASARDPIVEPPTVALCDARRLSTEFDEAFDLVITSPPYPNRMSYIRELRPYMYWLGYLTVAREAAELDWTAIGGTWGVATSRVGKWTPPEAKPIPYGKFEGILECIAADSDLLSRYVHKYFFDMTAHIADLRKVLRPGASVHYIVGNSKFYETMLPVQEIYAAMFDAAGFTETSIETIRKRSSKRELFEYVVSARWPS